MADQVEPTMEQQVRARIDEAAALNAPPEEPPKITSALVHQCLDANMMGDGTLYAALFRDELLFCNNSAEWYRWAGHYWQRDTSHRALASVEKVNLTYLAEYKRLWGDFAERIAAGADPESKDMKARAKRRDAFSDRVFALRGSIRRKSCLEYSYSIENPLSIRGEELDAKPWLYPCKNGVIDLKTGVLKPGRPSDYLTLASPIEFLGIDTPAPLWEKSLLEIFNGNAELPAYIQRLFGYGMTGIVKDKILPVFHGRTGFNGRSMIVETVSYVMGDLAAAIPAEMLLTTKFAKNSAAPSPDIMSLKGRRLAFASEIDEGQRFSVARVKLLTGNDSLVGRNPHDKDQTCFKPTHKLMLMTNTQPSAPAHDRSFWERMHLIPFDISFVNRDPEEPHERRANLNLGREILKEAPGILAWLVRGCLFWQRDGLNPPLAVKEASKKYQQNEDLFLDFIDECLDKEPGAKETAKALNNKFGLWYQETHGNKVPSGTWFGKQMAAHNFEKGKINGCVVYYGVCLKVIA
jgi:putative DNA primase/helicase